MSSWRTDMCNRIKSVRAFKLIILNVDYFVWAKVTEQEWKIKRFMDAIGPKKREIKQQQHKNWVEFYILFRSEHADDPHE